MKDVMYSWHKSSPVKQTINVFAVVILFLIGAYLVIHENPALRGKLRGIFTVGSEYVQPILQKPDPPGAKPLAPVRSAIATGPLKVDPANPRYFTDGSGKAIYLAGSHTWLNLQDGVLTDPPPAFNYTGWLDFLVSQNHNFFRLWVWEQTWKVAESSTPYYFSPHPWQRTGPGNALDGHPKFDLTKFNQAYFDRLRQRVIQAGDRGIYVAVMLFNGWSVTNKGSYGGKGEPWKGHPFNFNNNINHINGDTNGDNQGLETEDLSIPAVTAFQEAYVAKVIDTVNDLDNVLYEICNECLDGPTGLAWQEHMVDFIHNYEATKPKQHPVGITPFAGDDDLLNSNADWVGVTEGYNLNSTYISDGKKVVVSDTDHLCGICGNRVWVWKTFMHGKYPLFMDQYDDSYKLDGGGYNMNNPNDVSLRKNLGYTLTYANRVNLEKMIPHGELSSTGYALANPSTNDAEYLVYAPSGGAFNVNLSASPGSLSVEWFNPGSGMVTDGGTTIGGASRQFTAPFVGDAVLYIYQKGLSPTPTSTQVSPPKFKLFIPTIGH
jgi:hypothetical protein